jgi:hypothetical protein
MTEHIITKIEINRYLHAMLGRVDMIDLWWDSPNKAFNDKTPNDVYLADAEGRKRVYQYVMSCSDGHW